MWITGFGKLCSHYFRTSPLEADMTRRNAQHLTSQIYKLKKHHQWKLSYNPKLICYHTITNWIIFKSLPNITRKKCQDQDISYWQNNNFTMKGCNFGWVIYCAHRFFTSETVLMKWEMSPIVWTIVIDHFFILHSVEVDKHWLSARICRIRISLFPVSLLII